MCCMGHAGNTGRKNDAKNCHLRTITRLCRTIFATKACIDNRKKNLLNSNISSTCPHNMANFGPLTAAVPIVVLEKERWSVWLSNQSIDVRKNTELPHSLVTHHFQQETSEYANCIFNSFCVVTIQCLCYAEYIEGKSDDIRCVKVLL